MKRSSCPNLKILISSLKSTKVNFDSGLEQYIKDKELFTRDQLKALRNSLKDQIRELNKLFAQEFIVISPEGKETIINIPEQIKKTNEFLSLHNIPQRIPENIKLTDKSVKEFIELGKRFGFDSLLFIPKGISPNDLINNPDFIVFSGSPQENQNTDPEKTDPQNPDPNKRPTWINENIKTKSKILSTKTTKIQILAYKQKDHVDTKADHTQDTRDNTYPQIQEIEKKLKLEGLDLTQALFLDRLHFDNTQSHLFVWNKNNAVWLTKTAEVIPGQCVNLRWGPDDRQFFLPLHARGNHYDDLGSVFSRSLEYEEKWMIYEIRNYYKLLIYK